MESKTRTSTFEFSGVKGVVLLGAIAAMVALRVSKLEDAHDENLVLAVKNELAPVFDGGHADLSAAEVNNRKEIESLRPAIEIERISVSLPLLTFQNKEKAYLRVEYVAGDDREKSVVYYRSKLSRRLDGDDEWLIEGKSNAYFFYSNLL